MSAMSGENPNKTEQVDQPKRACHPDSEVSETFNTIFRESSLH